MKLSKLAAAQKTITLDNQRGSGCGSGGVLVAEEGISIARPMKRLFAFWAMV